MYAPRIRTYRIQCADLCPGTVLTGIRSHSPSSLSYIRYRHLQGIAQGTSMGLGSDYIQSLSTSVSSFSNAEWIFCSIILDTPAFKIRLCYLSVFLLPKITPFILLFHCLKVLNVFQPSSWSFHLFPFSPKIKKERNVISICFPFHSSALFPSLD